MSDSRACGASALLLHRRPRPWSSSGNRVLGGIVSVVVVVAVVVLVMRVSEWRKSA